MSNRKEFGFSLIELLLVVVVIGIIAAMAIPMFQRAARAAENGSAVAVLRTISSTQVSYFSQNNRFGRLAELLNIVKFGSPVAETVVRGPYLFEMSPLSPSDDDLRREYTITATSSRPNEAVYKYELTQAGTIVQLLP